MSRTLVVGDIHGGYKALLQCLERSGFDKQKDTLIQLGDVADGWSEVPECVEELLTIKNLISIKGNHDEWCEKWMKYRTVVNRNWLTQGGRATYEAYVHYHLELINKHEEYFFNKQHLYYVDDKNRGFVHGGFVSRKGLGHEAYKSNYYWDRDLWSLALSQNGLYTKGNLEKMNLAKGIPSGQRFLNHEEVFIGHTSTCNWNAKGNYIESEDPNQILNGPITVPMKRCNVWNLDTGGGFFGKLTIMDVDTKEYWQSDFVKDLYPNEVGR